MNNPMLMNMASTMMSDPNMQRMMGQIMSGGLPEADEPNSMDNFLRV